MAAGGSTKIVLIALGANFTIACAKFGAFLWTGSSAMLSEAVHSLADTSNQGLLLYGQKRAQRPPDTRHPFGYTKELYFWSFVVAILLFSIGSGVAIYEGVEKLANPHPMHDPTVNYVVLAIAAVLEGYAITMAIREFQVRHRGEQIFSALRGSKDPALFTILLEDAAALSGLLVAFIGILLADVYDFAEADGIASIVIGLILAYVAAFIAVEVKGLLVGEAATPAMRAGIRDIIQREVKSLGGVRSINEIRTMQLGANSVLVAASVDFDDKASAGDVKAMTQRLETEIRDNYRDVTRVFVEVQSEDDHQRMLAAERAAAAV